MKDKIRSMLSRLFGRLAPSGGTAEQTVKSGIWLGLMNFLNRGLQIVMIIVLANLLAPADFGLMGIALLALSALKKFSNLGLSTALIQDKDENVDGYLNTAWVLQLARGIVIVSILVVAAPLIASVFGEPRVTDVLRVIAISPLLLAVRNPAVVYFQKNLDFHKEFLYNTSGSIAQFCVALGYALVFPTVWALVFGFIVADVVRLLVSYLAHPFRPWPEFDLELAKDLIGYGKWITGNSILVFLITEGDDIIVGWLLGATQLAFYQNAYRLSNAPATEITQVIAGVMFPAYSTLQEDLAAVRRGYFRTLQITTFVTFPAALGIAAVAPVFVSTFMGAEWMPMVATLQLLTVYGLLRSVGKTTGPVFQALGRPDIVTKLAFVRLVLIAIFIIPAVRQFGIEGAAMVIVGVALFPMLLLDIYALSRLLEASYRQFFRDIMYPLLASGVMFAAVVSVRQQVVLSGVPKFLLLLVTGVLTYVVAIGVIELRFGWGIRRNLKSLLSIVSGS
jgi:PST family polysaccharide transporter/lipopolysaccharide exporter